MTYHHHQHIMSGNGNGNGSGGDGDCSYLMSCVRFSKTIPVLFITAVVIWSYYAYVVQLCLMTVLEPQKQALYITFFHAFLFFFLWSYYKTIFTRIKTPREDFYLSEAEVCEMNMLGPDETPKSYLEKRARHVPIYTRTANGCVRYCEKCRCIKPDRSHHCGVCQQCVLKMDHHCPWVNNCVGFSNYKFFILFLFYSVLYCVYVSLTSVEYFVKFWSEIQKFQAGKFNLLFLFFISTMFGISISALLVYHIYLAAKNRTTLESFRPSIFLSTGLADKNGFDLGARENLKQIFGDTWWKALVPIKTSTCDGIYFPLSREQTMALTNATVNSNIYLAASNPNSSDSLLVSKRLVGGGGNGGGGAGGGGVGSINHSKISLE